MLTEYQECVLFVEWLERMHLKFSHIPQETFTRSWGIKMKNHRMGVRRGVPDYIIIAPKALLFVEMKRSKGGTVSKEQKDWIAMLNTFPSVKASVARGLQEAIDFVKSYL